ncbi:hypothetical protein [Streptomyces sp. NRRL S-350]|uniref:hypothetical protein n=1 Tax=Streptomyces sp. NRRL S-350 TaxID=1463902 RepID=UPI00131BC0DF|nr:hypothetical protein [Streptomyces sp. NRRL S-350]
MRNIRTQVARATASVAGAIVLLAAGAVTAPVQAQAAPLGRVCMINSVDGAQTFGHIGWAFKVRGDRDHWIYGATEASGSLTIDPGPNTNSSWIKGSSWSKMLGYFRGLKVKQGDHWVQEYSHWRCEDTRDGDVGKAQEAYRHERDNGYNVADNNCLTKSLKILKGYSTILARDPRLPIPPLYRHPSWNAPNNYFREGLDQANWEGIQRL